MGWSMRAPECRPWSNSPSSAPTSDHPSVWVLPPVQDQMKSPVLPTPDLASLALFNYVVKFPTGERREISNFISWREKLRQIQSLYLRSFPTSCLQLWPTTTLQSRSPRMGSSLEVFWRIISYRLCQIPSNDNVLTSVNTLSLWVQNKQNVRSHIPKSINLQNLSVVWRHTLLETSCVVLLFSDL